MGRWVGTWGRCVLMWSTVLALGCGGHSSSDGTTGGSGAVAATGGAGGSGGSSGTGGSGGSGGSSGTGGSGGSGGSGTGGSSGAAPDCPSGSLCRFEGEERSESAPWASPASLRIDGRNGSITLLSGESGVIKASVLPFVFRAQGVSVDEIEQDLTFLVLEVTSDAAGNVIVRTSRNDGARSTLGGDLRVWLPPEFDGALDVHQDNGETDLGFTASAPSVTLDSANGSCRVRAGQPTEISLFCDNGELDVGLAGVPAGVSTRRIETGGGSIKLALPGGKFSVQALARDGGIVDTGNAEARGCVVQVAAQGSKTVSCGGATAADPVLEATAAGTELSDVVLSF